MNAVTTLAALALVVSPVAMAGAQQTVLSGQITDTANIPVPGARILVVELGRRTSTAPDGTYRLGSIPFGSYTLSISRLGLVPQTKRIQVSGPATSVNVALAPAGIDLAPVQVTASTGATRAQDSPQPTSVMEGAELRVSQATALGDVLEQIPGVRTLSMTTGIGKPVIRGMTHYRVVTLDNGQRTETQAWGHDHSPNVETATAERIEVIKGPSSVLYGSDALGGVINVIAQSLPDAIDLQSFVRGKVSGSYNHNIRGMDGTISAEGASSGFGARLGLTSRSSGDMRTPAGRLDNTNNRAIAPEAAAGYRGARGNISARYSSRVERIEIYDDPAKVPDYTGFQKIESHRASVDATAALGSALIQANAGFEQNSRREFASADASAPDLGLFVRNWTGFAHLNHAPIGVFSGTLGVSGMLSNFENRGSRTLIPNSETRTAAIYLFEQAEVGRWKTMFGARLDGRILTTGGNASIGVPPQTRSFNAITGSAGALYKVTEPLALVVNVASGFRAPSAPDLFANGFHEGTRAFERGNPDLDVERSLNVDAGLRVTSHDVTGEVTAFINRVSDYIYLRPFGTSGSAFDSLQVVQGDARLIGLEGRLAWRPVSLLTLQMSGDYVRGQNTTADVPLTFIPPLRLIYGARVHGESLPGVVQPYMTASFETNWKQTRTDPRDFAPPGYTVASLGAGAGRVLPRGLVTVDLSVKNVFDARYRSFMSRYKEYALAPGRVVTLRITTPL